MAPQSHLAPDSVLDIGAEFDVMLSDDSVQENIREAEEVFARFQEAFSERAPENGQAD